MYSAYPPSAWQPLKRADSQRFSRPLRQNRQVPHDDLSQAAPTRWPTSNRPALSPALSTTPTTS